MTSEALTGGEGGTPPVGATAGSEVVGLFVPDLVRNPGAGGSIAMFQFSYADGDNFPSDTAPMTISVYGSIVPGDDGPWFLIGTSSSFSTTNGGLIHTVAIYPKYQVVFQWNNDELGSQVNYPYRFQVRYDP